MWCDSLKEKTTAYEVFLVVDPDTLGEKNLCLERERVNLLLESLSQTLSVHISGDANL